VSLLTIPAVAQRPQQPTGSKTRLVLLIVIDQFRYDYLTRFEDLFGPGGFRRLLQQGAVFTNANYSYTPTVTACGHATFMSGSLPSLHGIIGNEWFDRGTDREVTSVSDNSVKLLGGKSMTPASPSRLIGSTVGDQLRLTNRGRSKVVGVALKDRSAILPAGKNANGAYWFDTTEGVFVSSTYYFSDLPQWVKRFNQTQRADKYFGARWDRLLPPAAYERSLADENVYEESPWGNHFPYTINGGETTPGKKFYDQFDESPQANEYTVAFAKAAIEGEGLGQDDQTDLLTVSFSANDGLGHRLGPYSQEVEDMTLRTDRVLANLFRYIDQKVGLANTIVVLTADHGVAPIPEHARDLGFGGGRQPIGKIVDAVKAALNERFGTEQWVRHTVNGNIYFDYNVISSKKADRSELERLSCEAAQKIEGVAQCFTRTQFLSGQLLPGTISSRAVNGFNPERNGDIVIVLKPFYMHRTEAGTTHGTPYSYDTHVPVIFLGRDILPGSYGTVTTPSDIAPTLAALLKIEPPSNAVGRILDEALRRPKR
jgi:predicted AlkP superfamily pyrophosphatase or phosphodiesterase